MHASPNNFRTPPIEVKTWKASEWAIKYQAKKQFVQPVLTASASHALLTTVDIGIAELWNWNPHCSLKDHGLVIGRSRWLLSMPCNAIDSGPVQHTTVALA
ncbi:hypothetical protein V6N13_138812 [Hibiscus sabdariffa]|uniref:Uncharacterized protein n=1 Tax=Hibiscus sabdariffa TaxID=183260 RepID=A0ABR2PK11_9ROSI